MLRSVEGYFLVATRTMLSHHFGNLFLLFPIAINGSLVVNSSWRTIVGISLSIVPFIMDSQLDH